MEVSEKWLSSCVSQNNRSVTTCSLWNSSVHTITDIATGFSCLTSILASFGILICYTRCPAIRTTSKSLLLYLTLADFLTASGNLVGLTRDILLQNSSANLTDAMETLCIAQSIVTTYSSMCSFFWTAAISYFILLPVAKNWMLETKFLVTCHVICWFVPAAIVTVAATTKVLGADYDLSATGSWCWIKSNINLTNNAVLDCPYFWQVTTGKFWEITVYVLTALNYFLLKFILYKRKKMNSQMWAPFAVGVGRVHKKEDKNFLFVPIVLYLLRLWGTLRFFLQFQPDPCASLVLLPLQGYGDSGQAFWNFIIFFVLDSSVRSQCCPSKYFQFSYDYDNSTSTANLESEETGGREASAFQ